jgi:hypothetical protein
MDNEMILNEYGKIAYKHVKHTMDLGKLRLLVGNGDVL